MKRPRAGSRRQAAIRFLQGTALVLGSSVVCLVLLEWGIRIFDPQPAVRYRYDPDSFYVPEPGAHFVYRRVEFENSISYNSFGMRDRERTLDKPSGTGRVALMGDSQVEAKEVLFDSTFGQRVERGIERRHREDRIEILNFGVSGYGTVASLARYRALATRFAPDAVVYVFMDNDLTDNIGKDRQLFEIADGQLVLQRLPNEGWTRFWRTGLDVIKRRFQTYAFVRFRLSQLASRVARSKARSTQLRGDPAAATPGLPPEAGASDLGSEESWRILRAALVSFAATVRADGAQFAVVQAGTRSDAMTARLRDLCAELGIEYFDVVPSLRGAGPIRYRYDGHWNSEGHRRAAAALVPFLERLLDADSPGSPEGAPRGIRASPGAVQRYG